jgi:hypothetical protein
MRRRILVALIFVLAALPLAAQQQLRLPRPSPKASVMQTSGLTDITINYNRPGVKGRKIWGALVPYNAVWRTGANEATTIAFSDDVTIGGQKVPKGMYSLHTIPGTDEWTVIFNSVAEQWGSYSYDAAKDVVRVKVKPEMATFTEWLTFDVPEVSTDSAKVVMRWENVAVPFTVNTDSTAKAMAAAQRAITSIDNDRWLIPLRAADFAFQNDRMDEASRWLDQAMKERENTGTLWLKARIQARKGERAAAIRTAEAAIAKAGPNDAAFAGEIKKISDTWR